MLLSLLGPVELRDESGRLIAVASRRQRQLLVALTLEQGSVVSVDQLSERILHSGSGMTLYQVSIQPEDGEQGILHRLHFVDR